MKLPNNPDPSAALAAAPRTLRVAISALGCKVSAADALALEDRLDLSAGGIAIVPFPEPADAYVLFTCTVTHAADRDTRKTVARLKRQHPDARVILTGCLVATDAAAAAALHGVDAVVSHREVARIPALLKELGPAASGAEGAPSPAAAPRAGLGPLRRGRDRPYLKVQDGCDAFCAYCVLPRARGKLSSVPRPEVLASLRRLAAEGAPEVVLAGINLGRWGRDLEPQQRLLDLLRAVLAERAVPRLRLSSVEPDTLDEELVELLASSPEFCRHLHLPLQSGDDGVLAAMGRPYRFADYAAVVARLRKAMPDLSLSSDLVVGFPGETAAAHATTLARVGALGFDSLHVFSFSPRPGTRAAHLPDDVPPPEKRRRSQELIELGALGRRHALERARGAVLEVLVEQRRDRRSGLLQGYSRGYLPLVLEEPAAGDAAKGRILSVLGLEPQGERLRVREVSP